MKKLIKNSIWYFIGAFLLFIGLFFKLYDNTFLLEGNIFYFLKYVALPYIVWIFIIGGIVIILIESLREHHLQKALNSANQPVNYFIIFAIFITSLSIILNSYYNVALVSGVMLTSIILSLIFTKNYHYIGPAAFLIILILDLLFRTINISPAISLMFNTIFLLYVAQMIYIIIRMAVSTIKKTSKKSEFDLLTDFIVSFLLFIFLLVVIARQYSEFLLNLICFFITVYATFKMFNSWKKYTRSKENATL